MPHKFEELRHGVETGLGTYQVRFPNSVHEWRVVKFDHDYVVLEGVRHGSVITARADQTCYVLHSFLYRGKPVDSD